MTASRPWKAATLALLVLGPFFFVTYGLANWLTGLRAANGGVGSIAFGWERRIPFLPWTVVPYWSTDLFYAVSLFLCATRLELRTHVQRLIAVQVFSVAGFLLFPLRFSFERPQTAGFCGSLFGLLGSFDQSFNQAPSLHLGLTVVLWARYSAHLKGWPLWIVRAWLVLTGVSTLTTYQHHFIDVPTGIWVGLLSLAIFPDDQSAFSRVPQDGGRRWVLGAAYCAGFVALAVLAWQIQGLAWLVLWPAGSLLIVAGIYWSGSAGFFGKKDGAIGGPLRVLLAPYLACAWLNSRLWTGRCRAHEILDGVWLGRVPRRAERDALGMTSLVDVTAELPVATEGVAYRHVPVLDMVLPTVEQLDAMVQAIDEVRPARPTLVFCALGYSRSAMAVSAWMLAQGHAATVEDAVNMVQARRPEIALSTAHRHRLEEWRCRGGSQ